MYRGGSPAFHGWAPGGADAGAPYPGGAATARLPASRYPSTRRPSETVPSDPSARNAEVGGPDNVSTHSGPPAAAASASRCTAVTGDVTRAIGIGGNTAWSLAGDVAGPWNGTPTTFALTDG